MGSTTMDIVGLDDQRLELALPQPFRSESKTELALPQPFKSESTSRTELTIREPIRTEGKSEMSLDIRPLVTDTCLTINIGSLPETCVRKPYQHHFGLTIFGMEIMGFNLSGESQTIIQDLPKQPQIAWGGQRAGHSTRHAHPHGAKTRRETGEVSDSRGGLRIRIGS
jgi:hypothetical protein